ncbi:hypothetical protein D0C16_24260 [Cellvibrio sp. KY-GH-1]|nr:hypothetical protein D0C16_24260 [Cellvibrio sp. KY-GH-1]
MALQKAHQVGRVDALFYRQFAQVFNTPAKNVQGNCHAINRHLYYMGLITQTRDLEQIYSVLHE